LKKLEVESEKDKLESEAFKGFHAINDRIRHINHSLAVNRKLGFDDRVPLGFVLKVARDVISAILGDDPSCQELFLAARHGSGTSLGVKYTDTAPEAKWCYPISCTESIKPAIVKYLNWDYQLAASLPSVSEPEMRFSIVDGSRATTVPKDVKKRRMIAIEPTGNMFIQQGLMRVMYRRMKFSGIDVGNLPRLHQRLAMESSITGSDATIDFSSASDSVSDELVRFLFPRSWLAWMYASRSPVMEIDGVKTVLEMYATMGNATTFPVETLVFYSLGVGCSMYYELLHKYGVVHYSFAKYRTGLPELRKRSLAQDLRVSVFGDDCIIPTDFANSFITVCEDLGFQVNRDKTFLDGHFRESCGGDFYYGRLVRPLFIKGPQDCKRRTSLEAWLYTVWN
jgi:hypothetical protein